MRIVDSVDTPVGILPLAVSTELVCFRRSTKSCMGGWLTGQRVGLMVSLLRPTAVSFSPPFG